MGPKGPIVCSRSGAYNQMSCGCLLPVAVAEALGSFLSWLGQGSGPIPAAWTSTLFPWMLHSSLCLCYILNLALLRFCCVGP